MNLRNWLRFSVFLFSWSLLAQTGDVSIHAGFGTGKDYLKMSKTQQRAYAMGFVNGFLLSPLAGAPKSKIEWAERCLERMTDLQVSEILAKYIREHPGEWHHQLHLNSWRGLADACPDSPLKQTQ